MNLAIIKIVLFSLPPVTLSKIFNESLGSSFILIKNIYGCVSYALLQYRSIIKRNNDFAPFPFGVHTFPQIIVKEILHYDSLNQT